MPLKRVAFLFLNSGVHQLTALWVLMDKLGCELQRNNGITLLFFLLALRSSFGHSDSKLSDSRVCYFGRAFCCANRAACTRLLTCSFCKILVT